MNDVPVTRDAVDRLILRALDFLAGAVFVLALIALGFYLHF